MEGLPPEIYNHIYNYLDPLSRNRFRYLNKSLRRCFKHSPFNLFYLETDKWYTREDLKSIEMTFYLGVETDTKFLFTEEERETPKKYNWNTSN